MGIDRGAHYQWKKHAKYARDFEAASIEAAQALEDEAVSRAMRGVQEPVFYQGVQCGTINRRSDGLMQFLLRGLKPERYRRDALEITGAGGGPLQSTMTIEFIKP